MKHEKAIKKMCEFFHKPWMSDADKADMDASFLKMMGDELDQAIAQGVANGHTEEFQVKLMLKGFHMIVDQNGDESGK